MRTTPTNTWLLLLIIVTLNFLLGGVRSDVDATTAAKDPLVATTGTTVTANAMTATRLTVTPTTRPTTPGTTLRPTTKTGPFIAPTQPSNRPTAPPPPPADTKTHPPVTLPTASTATPLKPTTATNSPPVVTPGTNTTRPSHVIVDGRTLPAATAPPSQATTVATVTTTKAPVVSVVPSVTKTSVVISPSGNPAVTTTPTRDVSTAGSAATTKVPTTTPTPGQRSNTAIATVPGSRRGDSDGATKEPLKTTTFTPTASRTTSGQQQTTEQTSSQTRPVSTLHTGTTAATSGNTRRTPRTSSSAPIANKFTYSLLGQQELKEDRELAEVCRRLMSDWQNGTCSLTWRHSDGRVVFDLVEINGHVRTSLASQLYDDITKKPSDNKTLIAILASCGALLIMIVILAVCASHHRKPYSETQHLTEELQTVENGYHDNPTLEVMEVQPEMQEKKTALNGEFNDSWIVPIDNLLKDELPDEEDTHL